MEFIKLNFFFYEILESPKTNECGLVSILHIIFSNKQHLGKKLDRFNRKKKKRPKPCSAYNQNDHQS